MFIADFPYLLIGDVNNNGRPELYGFRKNYTDKEVSNIFIYEYNGSSFDCVYSYPQTLTLNARGIFDIDGDGNDELHLRRVVLEPIDSVTSMVTHKQLFYKKSSYNSFADSLLFQVGYYNPITQINDVYYGDFDNDKNSDIIFIYPMYSVRICEYNPFTTTYDSVYDFNFRQIDSYFGGFAVGDFDDDGKLEFVLSSVDGKVVVIENNGDNKYKVTWIGERPYA